MRSAIKITVAALAAGAGALLPLAVGTGFVAPAEAHDYKKGNLVVDHPWARPTAETAKNAAVYLEVRNNSGQTDTLIGAKTAITSKVELHSIVNENGVMKMRLMAEGIEIPAGGAIKLDTGGAHFMLIGIKEPLQEGTRHPIAFVFKKAGEIAAEITIEKKPAAAGPAGSSAHKNHH